MAELRASGLDLIREYIPDSPEYNSEDEPGQYNIPYVPHNHLRYLTTNLLQLPMFLNLQKKRLM